MIESYMSVNICDDNNRRANAILCNFIYLCKKKNFFIKGYTIYILNMITKEKVERTVLDLLGSIFLCYIVNRNMMAITNLLLIATSDFFDFPFLLFYTPFSRTP
ncbi:hypothetical protein AAHE18_01G245400 [Arachis hypogaea]